MKVLILSSSDVSGGAAIASFRLHCALIKNGVNSNMLVRHRSSCADSSILAVNQLNYFAQKEIHPRFALEKLFFMPYEKSKKVRFAFSTNKFGFPIHNNNLVKEADIIHLHWINNAFISLLEIEKIFSLGKPVVWTLHDMWSFTGGCHYAGGCENFKLKCGNCPILKNPSTNDLSSTIFDRKKKIYADKNFTIVTCSKWLAKIASESTLLKSYRILDIPNPIDQKVFHPMDERKTRVDLGLNEKKIYLLFAAGNILDERKGIRYLIEALDLLKEDSEVINKIELLVVGKSKGDLNSYFPVPTKYLGQVYETEKMCKIYNAAHAFLLPSMQDNLPNTVMESLACGTPVIAFETGGIPEMIVHHKTGFLAKEYSSNSLAEGIKWIAENSHIDFQADCTGFVNNNYGEKKVAGEYVKLYQKLIRHE
jgi:glycosyltransferase involved in cell wall biosynthesis